jgi:hypothetical protein
MSTAKSPADVKALLEQQVVGRTVRELAVHGINALKSIEPALTTIAGERVLGSLVEDRQHVVLQLETVDVVINLERTGALEWMQSSQTWTPTPQATHAPTLRLLLEDGTGVDFKEPGRTKRITVTLLSRQR